MIMEPCAVAGCSDSRAMPFSVCSKHRAEQDRRPAVTTPSDVADLFVATCERLCAMGATRVEGFGLVACFGPKPVPETKRPEPEQRMPSGLTPDQQQLWMRSQALLSGGAR